MTGRDPSGNPLAAFILLGVSLLLTSCTVLAIYQLVRFSAAVTLSLDVLVDFSSRVAVSLGTLSDILRSLPGLN